VAPIITCHNKTIGLNPTCGDIIAELGQNKVRLLKLFALDIDPAMLELNFFTRQPHDALGYPFFAGRY
jgi:hypothetical protein